MSSNLYAQTVSYTDRLYGEWKIPTFLDALTKTKTMQRLKDISLDTIPQSLSRWPLANRFDHGMGATRLMAAAMLNTIESEKWKVALAATAVHDAGSTPFSHLCEFLLRKRTGHDSESFLSAMVDGFGERKLFEELGVPVETLAPLINAKGGGFSIVLSGTLDVDNADNILRYYVDGPCEGKKESAHDALLIAGSFQRHKGVIGLDANCRAEVKRWKRTRRAIYAFVYSEPHHGIAVALQRAVALADQAGKLPNSFLYLTDEEGLKFLSRSCGAARKIVERLRMEMRYHRVFACETTTPTPKLLRLIENPDGRTRLADTLAEKLGVPQEDVCVYVGKGKETRKIELPFFAAEQSFLDNDNRSPMYRFRVYLAPHIAERCRGRIPELAVPLID